MKFINEYVYNKESVEAELNAILSSTMEKTNFFCIVAIPISLLLFLITHQSILLVLILIILIYLTLLFICRKIIIKKQLSKVDETKVNNKVLIVIDDKSKSIILNKMIKIPLSSMTKVRKKNKWLIVKIGKRNIFLKNDSFKDNNCDECYNYLKIIVKENKKTK